MKFEILGGFSTFFRISKGVFVPQMTSIVVFQALFEEITRKIVKFHFPGGSNLIFLGDSKHLNFPGGVGEKGSSIPLYKFFLE